MKLEYKSLIKRNIRVLTPLSPYRKNVGCKWVFKVKENLNDNVNKYKARLFSKRYHQQYEFDFNETFSPVIKLNTIYVILTLALTYKWERQ